MQKAFAAQDLKDAVDGGGVEPQALAQFRRPHLMITGSESHKNIQSLIRSSELRGAIILTLLACQAKIVEYTPAQIKLTTTGNGRASKKQVRYFIEKTIMKHKSRLSSHAIDAVAIAYTASRKIRSEARRRKMTGD